MGLESFDRNAREAPKPSHRGYVPEVGRIVDNGTAEALLADSKVRNAYLAGGR